jgi:hypothetical protein
MTGAEVGEEAAGTGATEGIGAGEVGMGAMLTCPQVPGPKVTWFVRWMLLRAAFVLKHDC